MKNINLKFIKGLQILSLIIISTFILTACNNDDDGGLTEKAKPTIEKVEIGLNNNEIGVIGKDFHFNAEVTAGENIELITVSIKQKSTEVYSSKWEFNLDWDQYKGNRNATIHKHFDIPEDAVEGKYDFIIKVTDKNGTSLEEKRTITLYKAENVPVQPEATIFNIFSNDARFYRNGKFTVEGSFLKKDDKISSQVTLSNVKGDGKMYIVLINKKLSHRPESINQIDFNKTIVYDVVEHKEWTESNHFSNSTFDPTTNIIIRQMPDFYIGAEKDNNLPTANTINGDKKWESGTYYFGVIYHNSTYNIGYYKYIEIPIQL